MCEVIVIDMGWKIIFYEILLAVIKVLSERPSSIILTIETLQALVKLGEYLPGKCLLPLAT